jgi:hypothetical protein
MAAGRTFASPTTSIYRQVIIARICQTPITFAPAHKKDGQASAQNDILENRTKTGQLI